MTIKSSLLCVILCQFQFRQSADFYGVKQKTKQYNKQSSKKVPSSCLGQVDFPVGQVTFSSHLPNGQGPRQVICQLNRKKSNLRLAQGKQNLRATKCPKGRMEFKFFRALNKFINSSKFGFSETKKESLFKVKLSFYSKLTRFKVGKSLKQRRTLFNV